MSYGRICTLRIGEYEIRHRSSLDLRIAFSVDRDKTRDPNAAMVSVWNLSPETRGRLEDTPRLFCELSAGYQDEGEHRIFSGVLLGADSSRDGAGWVTTMELGDDGETPSALATIARTFPEGMQIATVLSELVKACGIKTTGLSSASSYARLAGSATLPRPWTASGQALGALHAFCRSLGFQYSIQNQAVVFLGLGRGTSGSGPLIRSENIEGPVTIDAEGTVAFSCKMIPDLVPGSPLRLDADRVQGDYAAIVTQHTGDTHGAQWSVLVEADPLDRVKTKGLRVV